METRGHLRRVVVEIDPEIFRKFGLEKIFEKVESINSRQFLRIDLEEGIKILLSDIKMKPGYAPEEVQFPQGIEVLHVLKRDGDLYTCILKSSMGQALERFMGMDWESAKKVPPISEAKELFEKSFGVVPDSPLFLSQERALFGFLGDRKAIDVIIRLLRFFDLVKSVSFPGGPADNQDILPSLTDRQRQVVSLAKDLGYYEYPRRISTAELAERLGLRKTTLIEHLRKAENKVVSSLFVG